MQTVLFCRRVLTLTKMNLVTSPTVRTCVGYQESVVSSNFCNLVEASRYSQTSIEFAYLSSCLSITLEGEIEVIDMSNLLQATQTMADWVVIDDFNYWYKVPGPKSVSK